MNTVRKFFVVCFFLFFFSGFTHAAPVWVGGPGPYIYHVSHFYEFDPAPAENPSGLWWCGQTALKMVVKFKTGAQYSLSSIHTVLAGNNGMSGTTGLYTSTNCSGGWCSYLEDLVFAAKRNYNIPLTSITYVSNYGWTFPPTSAKNALYTAVKSYIDARRPVIAFADLNTTNPTGSPTVGHAWVIVAYDTAGVSNPTTNASSVKLYLRNNNRANPVYAGYDDIVTVDTFYRMMAKNTANQLKVAGF
jgi:hypothetical protein